MNGRPLFLLLAALFAFLMCGCSSSPTKLSQYLDMNNLSKKFAKTHEQIAREYEAEGALNEARREWQLVDAVQLSETSPARVEIARLDRKATLLASMHMEAAHRARREADYKTARLELLKALALKPDNASAIKKLKELEGRRSYANLALVPRVSDVLESEVDVYTAPNAMTRNGKNARSLVNVNKEPGAQVVSSKSRVKKNVRKSEIKGLENSFQRGLAHLSRKEYKFALQNFLIVQRKNDGEQEIVDEYVAITRKALANQHYDKGVIAFRAARYDQAVNEFEQALEYLPGHKKARFYRSSAKALQEQ